MLDPVMHSDSEIGRVEVKNTTCYMCACRCGIRVTLRDGQVRHIEGNPDHPLNKGVICAKGASGSLGPWRAGAGCAPLLASAACSPCGGFRAVRNFVGLTFIRSSHCGSSSLAPPAMASRFAIGVTTLA